jgi:hypothetical protein
MVPVILIFSQIVSFQIYFYPLLIFGGIISLPLQKLRIKLPLTGKDYYFFWFYLFFLSIVALITYYKGSSLELIIWNLRFFYGIGFVVLCFKLISSFYIGRAFFWTMISLCIYESFCLNILDSYPIYWQFSGFDLKFLLGRANQDGFYAVLGPTLNSSVSGTIYAVIFFIMLQNHNDIKTNNFLSDKLLVILSLICVLLVSSTVAFGVLFIGMILNFRNILIKHKILLLILVFTSLVIYQLFPVFNSLSFDPVSRVMLHKYFSLTSSYSLSESFFGWSSLSNIHSTNMGGDFMFLHQLLINGIVATLLFLYALFALTPKKYRIFLALGVLSTFHYGAIYALIGQLFFGAIIANKLKL